MNRILIFLNTPAERRERTKQPYTDAASELGELVGEIVEVSVVRADDDDGDDDRFELQFWLTEQLESHADLHDAREHLWMELQRVSGLIDEACSRLSARGGAA